MLVMHWGTLGQCMLKCWSYSWGKCKGSVERGKLCGVVWCGVPKALLPKGKGRDVYPRVQVNGLGCVCCVRAVCKCVVA